MNKHDRIAAFVDSLETGGDLAAVEDGDPARHPCFLGYLRLFNEARYYEAHDVLEHLWLDARGDRNFLFYKGLIQLAGAFVHLRLQHEAPAHPKHGRRLRPAARLFSLAAKNLAPFAPRHLGLDVDALLTLCASSTAALAADDFRRNPWSPDRAPTLAFARD